MFDLPECGLCGESIPAGQELCPRHVKWVAKTTRKRAADAKYAATKERNLSKYGLTAATLKDMVVGQGNVCGNPECRRFLYSRNGNIKAAFSVKPDGEIRGFLCFSCANKARIRGDVFTGDFAGWFQHSRWACHELSRDEVIAALHSKVVIGVR